MYDTFMILSLWIRSLLNMQAMIIDRHAVMQKHVKSKTRSRKKCQSMYAIVFNIINKTADLYLCQTELNKVAWQQEEF